MATQNDLREKLGREFVNGGLLLKALTHPSVAHEQTAVVETNQRLEFLGDAVLQLVLTRHLYEQFPQFGEGPLTKARAKLVNSRALAEQARHLGLGQHLIISHGEELSGGRDRVSSLADAYEALMGAIFLDGGFEVARQFILRQFDNALRHLQIDPTFDNPKGELQELLQAVSTNPPRYELAAVSGPDHDRMFECTVHHDGRELARGQGKSKKLAQSEAARAALVHLFEEKGPQTAIAPCPAEPNPK